MPILKITLPDEDATETFTSFSAAIKFCEAEFGYGKFIEPEVWKTVKKSKNFEDLKDFLWHDGLWVELHNG